MAPMSIVRTPPFVSRELSVTVLGYQIYLSTVVNLLLAIDGSRSGHYLEMVRVSEELKSTVAVWG